MPRYRRLPIFPAAGGGVHFPKAVKSIRFSRMGCSNRPFYHIVVNMLKRHQHDHCIEQLGTYDPLPNKFNERLVSMNIERLKYWLSHKTQVSRSVARLFGLSGLLPIHPTVYLRAWRRRVLALNEEKERLEAKERENDVEASENKEAAKNAQA